MVTELLFVRPPNISDLEDIVHINRVSLPENYAIAYFIELIKTWKSTSCVAEINNKVVGYNIVRIEKSSLTPWRPRGKSKAHVISIAVDPLHRRKGIGIRMMNFVLQKVTEMGNVDKMTLEVRESNQGAIKMYKELQFVTSKILQRYYSDGENAILMELNLK